ncbi:hypothetical protein ACFQ1L_34340 [Phytohabitans flavus]|uniref:hypothetical protein n=1 Tax=Phytohabitans flavus TaxID=1076124 RepID=UPI003630C7F9
MLDLYLANPISRRQFVLQRFVALTGVLVVLGLVPWLLVSLFNASLDMGVPAANVAAASLGLLLIGVCFGTLALAVSSVVGRRSVVLATTGAIAAGTYVLRVVGDLVGGLGFLRWLSPFHYYLGGDPLREGFDVAYLIVLMLIPAAMLAFAVIQFERRDVST